MTTTWVVIAHQTGARFMEHRSGFGKHLMLVDELENPDGRKKNRELETDRSGEAFTGARAGGAMRAMHHEHSAHEHVVQRFAREVADAVDRARIDGRFDDLILVAEPKFLGVLRDALAPATARRVVGSVTKDLAAVPPPAVASHISDVLPP